LQQTQNRTPGKEKSPRKKKKTKLPTQNVGGGRRAVGECTTERSEKR